MKGWMYMVVCMCDFVVFPVLWSVLQALGNHGHVETQWSPITLNGAGLFHMAMGAVLGVAAYGRTQEKLGGANNGGLQPPTTTPSVSAPAGGFGSSSGFGATITAVSTGALVIDGITVGANTRVLIKNETAGNAPVVL